MYVPRSRPIQYRLLSIGISVNFHSTQLPFHWTRNLFDMHKKLNLNIYIYINWLKYNNSFHTSISESHIFASSRGQRHNESKCTMKLLVEPTIELFSR